MYSAQLRFQMSDKQGLAYWPLERNETNTRTTPKYNAGSVKAESKVVRPLSKDARPSLDKALSYERRCRQEKETKK